MSQAGTLEDKMASMHAGNITEFCGSLKPGLLRQGGEQAPKVKTFWPHDFVMGYGKKTGLSYEDLDQTQWTLGYAAIVEQESDPNIARLMLLHLPNLMQDAQFSGFEAAKIAHGVILTRLERGRLTWSDVLAMSEVRRSVINAVCSQHKEVSNSAALSSIRGSRGFSSQGASGPSSVNNNNFKNVKKNPKICVYYNNKVCSHKGDHETNGTLYIHTCKICFRDHPEKDCNFL
jgi:hypothetical protein